LHYTPEVLNHPGLAQAVSCLLENMQLTHALKSNCAMALLMVFTCLLLAPCCAAAGRRRRQDVGAEEGDPDLDIDDVM
jgi:hypothetical protein